MCKSQGQDSKSGCKALNYMREFVIDIMPSSDSTNTIAVYRMEPEKGHAVGIVQIVHGMTEHVERYRDFANLLCNVGYIVVGHDHLGHGKTSDMGGKDGYFGKKGSHQYLLSDIKNLFDDSKKRYGNLPFFMFGHSMGSFFARVFCYTYDTLPDGLIISGTGGPNPLSGFAVRLADFITSTKGDHAYSDMLNDLAFRNFCVKIKNPRTTMDWLTRDPEVVDRYMADKKCTFKFTASALMELFTINNKANKLSNVRKTPKSLPIIFISGEEDPVGLFGSGVIEAYTLYQKTGIKDLSLKLYPDARHELHNEINKEEVFDQLIGWINAHNNHDNTTQ